MIDKNGKIAGKLNVIDLIILVVIIAAAIFVGRRLISGDPFGVVSRQPVYMEFTTNEVKNYVAERLETGTRVYDETENNELGKVTDIKIGEAYYYEHTDGGKTVVVYPDDSVSVKLTSLAEGVLDGNGIVIGGTRYAIGHTFVIYAGDCKLYVRISGIDAA